MTSQSSPISAPARKGKAQLITLLIGVDLLLAGGVPILARALQSNVYFASGAAIMTVWTFFAFWLIRRNPSRTDPTTNSMRDAITAAFIVTYLVMVAWTAFFVARPVSETRAFEPITETLITNFTVLTGIVVGFYFGADAVKQVAQIRQQPSAIASSNAGASPADGSNV